MSYITWEKPRATSDTFQSLLDFVLDANPSDNIVYYRGPSGGCLGSVLSAAYSVYSRGHGELLQNVTDEKRNGLRIIEYVIQRNKPVEKRGKR